MIRPPRARMMKALKSCSPSRIYSAQGYYPHLSLLKAFQYRTISHLHEEHSAGRTPRTVESVHEHGVHKTTKPKAAKSNSQPPFSSQPTQILNYQTKRSGEEASSQGEVYTNIPGYVSHETCHSSFLEQLSLAMRDVLPLSVPDRDGISEAEKTRSFEKQYNPGLLNILLRPSIEPENLIADGTDKRFMPGPPNLWPCRVWARGQVVLHEPKPPVLTNDLAIWGGEYVKDVLVSRSGSKAFVTICKTFLSQGFNAFWNAASPDKVATVIRDPTRLDRKLCTSEYTLCFLRNKPNLVNNAKDPMPPPSLSPTFSHPFRTSRHLLFAWSSFSKNAHLIHFDPTYAREHYGLADTVVHGPLQLYLACEVLGILLARRAAESGPSWPILRSIRYECTSPLYVEQEARVCAIPIAEGDELSSKWQVWIQTGDGQAANVVFKAIVDVDWMVDHEESKTEHTTLPPNRKGAV